MPGNIVLWEPESCAYCDTMVKAAFFLPHQADEVRREAKDALRNWAEGFRKNRKGKPFLTNETWRQSLFPKKLKSQVYQGATTFKAKLPLVKLTMEAQEASSSQEQISSLSDLDTMERDIADEDSALLSPCSTPPRVSDEDSSSFRTEDQSYQASVESEADDEALVQSKEYLEVLQEVERGMAQEPMETEPISEPPVEDVQHFPQEVVDEALAVNRELGRINRDLANREAGTDPEIFCGGG